MMTDRIEPGWRQIVHFCMPRHLECRVQDFTVSSINRSGYYLQLYPKRNDLVPMFPREGSISSVEEPQ